MAQSKTLKFNSKDFEELDTPNLFINLWTYNYFDKHKPCVACDTYSDYCEKILRSSGKNNGAIVILLLTKLKNVMKSF